MLTLSNTTGRNTIAYYSAWLQRAGSNLPGLDGHLGINDNDKNGFMATIHQMDRTKGLDLLLHTPGGDVAATESLVHYLHTMFGRDIRAIIPQIAMSAGTMMACACNVIVMGKQSNLGPVDPQFAGMPANGVLKEFAQAKKEVSEDPSLAPIWAMILQRYHPTFIGECERAVKWSQEMVADWVANGMYAGEKGATRTGKRIATRLFQFGDDANHGRHITADQCAQIGLKVTRLESEPNDLQDKVLTVHHAFMHTMAQTRAVKIIENNLGTAVVVQAA